ncbi:Gfo/Idh/MocA family oxidoreductase [Paenibacillus cisolokensis]|jgi:predicted dehydrogenase|uniref:Oxidoreductase n=1 Tax=Paenibacillus cisolokensis TaxID=1658519 RepID=A0ABQ4NAC9_9BACL|nr:MULTISPECIES: Gfo/Idh/MocA family oxidoreductase [Paenibacillus]ALS26515.1 oxidoreductase [Paenibacillus sp. 32O-W]GIQ64909.1 hypothetical protein PACILC2_34770 [Paenibacillus cisolokensis]
MTIRVGIIGTGWFGMKHAELLAGMEGVRVAAFCGTSREKAERAAQRFAGAAAYADVREMLDGCKLDAAYICVPPFAHGDMEKELAERGIPFLVEKPLGVDEETPTAIADLVERRGLITSVGYHFRYMDTVQSAKRWLEGRTVGMAVGGWMGSMPGVAWWRKTETSGGQFVEQTTHIVDLLRYMLGEVTEVFAAYARRANTPDATVADVGTVTLKLASGAVASISNTCLIPSGGRAELHLYTDGGVAEIGPQSLRLLLPDQTVETTGRRDPYRAENEAFIEAVRTGDASGIRSTYRDAWMTHRVTVAANRSAASGLPVRL